MRVAVEATALAERGTGIARYTRELLRALAETRPRIGIQLMTNRPLPPDALPVLDRPWRRLRSGNVPSRALWMQAVLPIALEAARPDLCHFTNFDAPVISRIPFVVTMHDMSLLLAPELHPRSRVLKLGRLMGIAASRADAVVCPTKSARDDAIRAMGLDPGRVHVVSGAVAPTFARRTDASEIEQACRRYGLEPGFLLYVGTIEPRKNLVRLVRAFARLRRDGFAGQLAIAGGWGWKSESLRPTIDDLGLVDAVVLTGYVPDDDLVLLLNGARAFVYPSLYEGFGLPIIEAFACGVPTVTSDRGAMAEVGNGAALLADPEDEGALADALATALTDEGVRARLVAAGRRRAAEYTGAAAAEQAVTVYRAVLAARRG